MCTKLVLSVVTKVNAKLDDYIAQYPYREPFTVERIFDVVWSAPYSTLAFDLYRPIKSEGLLPVIVDVHGGGWAGGRKENNKAFCMELAKKGFAVFCPEYTLVPRADMKRQLQELGSFLNWLKENAKEYNCDLSRLFLVGDSAGGQLASTLLNCVYNKRLADWFGVYCEGISFIGACFIGGVLYAGSLARKPFMSLYFKPMLGKKYRSSRVVDLLNFTDNVAEECPPVLLVTSQQDFMKRDSIKAEKALKQKNIECELYYLGKSKQKHKLAHVFNIINPNWDESISTNNKIAMFCATIAGRAKEGNI